MEGPKRKLNALTIGEKVKVLQFLDRNPMMRKIDIATKFGIPSSTLSTILKNREYIERNYNDNKGKVKKIRRAAYPELEDRLRDWFEQSCDYRVSRPTLKQKAEDFAIQLGFNDFKASNGWLESFRNRQNIVFRKHGGENNLANQNVCEEWFRELYYILESYDPDDVFSAGEVGLFFRCLPSETDSLKGQKCPVGERSESRLTVLLAVNQSGNTKLPPLMIGQETKPKWLAHVKSLPMDYKANRKAWMTQQIFVDWLRGIDKSMAREERQIILFIDDCKAHSHLPKLENIVVKFFPSALGSELRPLDQGITKSFKLEYRKQVVRKLVDCIDQRETFPTINVLNAMRMADLAWRNVTEKTIKNCFIRAGLDKTCDGGGDNDERITDENLVECDDSAIVEQWADIKHKQNLNVLLEDFIDVDDSLQTCSAPDDSDDIDDDSVIAEQWASIKQDFIDVDDSLRPFNTSDDIDGDDKRWRECQKVTVKEAEKAIDTLRTFLESSENIGSEPFALIAALEKIVLEQKDLTRFC